MIVENGTVRGDPDHPANAGRLCSKGAALADTLGDAGRLLQPRIDTREVGWDEALGRIATRFSETIAAHGPDAVAFYASGQFLTEDYYVANKLMKGFIGSGNIDTNSRLCMASTVAGHVRAFGADIVPGIYEDWEAADLAIIVGGNTAWCHPILFQRLKAARAKRGTFVVVIDPRRTATCEIADLHLALDPGSDVALFDGLLVHLADTGALDADWIAAHTEGFAAALAAARESAGTLKATAAATGLAEADLTIFFERFAATRRTLTVFSQGVNQSSSGTDKVNAIVNCHLATGRIGQPGMGPFSVTGQPNAMGGREVGGLANQLAAHMRFDSPADIDRVGRFWGSERIARAPGLKAVDLFDAVLDGRIKAIWIMATNPAASMPRAGRVRAALEACPFVVVSDCWETDTTALADLVLPAASWGEKDGTVTNSERCISRQRPFRAAPGAARPDWWMLKEVARLMGWGRAFDYERPAEIFREHAALSGFENDGTRTFDLGALAALSDRDYDAWEPRRWPLSTAVPAGSGRLFSDGIFATPDGRAHFAATPFAPPQAATSRYFPYLLNTGRIRDQWHTMTRTGLAPRLMSHQDEPYLDLHPRDARKLGLDAGDLVRVRTAEAATTLRARPTAAQRPGEIFAAMHWTDKFASAGPIDQLTSATRDPISGQPELKATAAALAPVPTQWRGVLAGGVGPGDMRGFYHARVPGKGGDLWELRGWERLPEEGELAAWIDRLLGPLPNGTRTVLSDPMRGIFRIADIVDGKLRACLMLATNARVRLPDRMILSDWLGAECAPDQIGALLAVEESCETVLRPRLVCSCFSVGRSAIEDAFVDGSCNSVAAIGRKLRAGTNCGSCLPEIAEILREARVST